MLEETPEDIYDAKELLERIRNILTDDELDILIGNVSAEEVARERGVLPESILRNIRRKKNQIKRR